LRPDNDIIRITASNDDQPPTAAKR